MGFSLKHVMSFLAGETNDLKEILMIHREQMREKIDVLQQMEGVLDSICDHLVVGSDTSVSNLLDFIGKV